MKRRTLIWRSLRFHWRSHLGVVIGAVIGSAALIGALIVGDSVKGSLREHALQRLGDVHYALQSGDRLVRDALGNPRSSSMDSPSYLLNTNQQVHRLVIRDGLNGVLMLPGVASLPDGSARANHIQVVGVSPIQWPALAGWNTLPAALSLWFGDQMEAVDYLLPHQVSLFAGNRGPGSLWLDGVSSPNEKHPWTESQRALIRQCVQKCGAWQQGEAAFVSQSFASQLNVRLGDEFLLRVRKPTTLSEEAVVSPGESDLITLRLKVGWILAADQLGGFDLAGHPQPPPNVFLPLDVLGKTVGHPGRANLLLQGNLIEQLPPSPQARSLVQRLPPVIVRMFPVVKSIMRGKLDLVDSAEALPFLRKETAQVFLPEDAQLEIRGIEQPQTTTGGEYIQPSVEISSPRVFLDSVVGPAALTAAPGRYEPSITNGVKVLTYLANLIYTSSNATPYSLITAAGAPWTPTDMRDDEILVSQWLADDLKLHPGDDLSIEFYLPDSGARFVEATNLFKVRAIVPMRGVYADQTLMPQFPGIEKAETTAEWDTVFPLVHKIRPQDDDYWTQWRGTPKAFISLAAGQKMWANRFGDLTAIRFPVPTNSFTDTVRKEVYENLRANITPRAFGLDWQPIREQALKAAEQSQDFGGLFIGFSLFVIVAALLLMALLFQFSLEQRAPEIGTLLALGFTPKQVRRLLLREGAALAFLGGILGTLGGIGYAWAMLHGLATLWSDAVGGTALKFFVTPQTLVIGLLASTVVAVFTLWLALRKQARQSVRVLLAGDLECGDSLPAAAAQVPPRRSCDKSQHSKVGWLALVTALGLIGWTLARGDTANVGIFFGAGALVLIAGLSFLNTRLARRHQPSAILHSPSSRTLALRGLTRRRSRSLATVAMLACGTFLIVSIGVFRLDANRDATQRSSGTGGFALIGESTMPVVADLNTKSGRESFALNEADFADVSFVQFRVRAGDEASCLNLNRAQKPRLLGVDAHAVWDRFTFVANLDEQTKAGPWGALTHLDTTPGWEKDDVPAIGDAASIQWAMGRKVGDRLDYVDERGQPFNVRIVGAVGNSILQGQLIIDEAEFVKRFPGESGYKYFLIDAPTNRVADISAKLSRALQDVGLELTPAPRRLAQFNAVQNTYLGTFQILGGLGLMLGSAGLGIVVLRNVLERRGELAVLLAVGWPRNAVSQLVLREHLALLGLGLLVGLAAAIVAVLPWVLASSSALPWFSLSVTLAAVLANGVLWTWLTTRVALRGELLSILRGE